MSSNSKSIGPYWAKNTLAEQSKTEIKIRLTKCRQVKESFDGTTKLDGPAPKWTSTGTPTSTDCSKDWMQKNVPEKNYGATQRHPEDAINRFVNSKFQAKLNKTSKKYEYLVREVKLYKARLKLQEKKDKRKRGRKPILTDKQVIYLRLEARFRSVTSLMEETGMPRTVLENAIKGRTFKHLNHIVTPQF